MQIMKATGLDVRTKDFDIVFEEVLSEMDVTASSNNNLSDTTGNIKIEIELEQESDKNNVNVQIFT